jgi:hypothetical protein
MGLIHCGPQDLFRLLALTITTCVVMVKGSSYEIAMIINHSGPEGGGFNPDHCHDVVEASNRVKVTVDELYKMEIEHCMDVATDGLYTEGTSPLYKAGPTSREFFEETMDGTELMSLLEVVTPENQNERRLPPLQCSTCSQAPTCNTCQVCCYTCSSYNLCYVTKCQGCSQRRREEAEVEDSTSFDEEMRRLAWAALDENNRVKMAYTCTENVKETTRWLNAKGNYCMGNYLEVKVVPVIYQEATRSGEVASP